MGARQRVWGRNVMKKLRQLLSNKCRKCGAENNLEFDCIVPRGHQHHMLAIPSRATFYRREMEAGNLQLLCEKCHNKKSAADLAKSASTITALSPWRSRTISIRGHEQ